MPEYRVFGPPGTGKTTWLSKQVDRALYKHAPDEIAACSFTRAAAVELAGRDTGLPKHNIGTIHSLCYHALGLPPIAEVTPEFIEDWTAGHPQYSIKTKSGEATLDERPAECTALMSWNRVRGMRSKLVPDAYFAAQWEAAKERAGVLDFTDLLLRAPEALAGIKVLFVDEAQDLTPLQWQIVRQWGASAETFIVCGDDDQLLYQFLGADAETFLADLGDSQKRTLSHSYRLPRAVWEYAEQWIRKLGDRREPKEYQPRDKAGEVCRPEFRLDKPVPLVHEIRDRAAAGESVMLLASCGYMLAPLIQALRDEGVPYHNPYRRARGDWNPIRTIGSRALAFLQTCRQIEEPQQPAVRWWPWVEMLRTDGALERGCKKELRVRAQRYDMLTEDDLLRWITPELLTAIDQQDMTWLHQHATTRFQDALDFPLRVLRNSGETALRTPPKVIVGTIHSVKGGEADNVYVFPDLSRQAYDALSRTPQPERDALVRLAYVAMTRARRRLALCAPGSRLFWRW